MNSFRPRKAGFTVLEILVAVTIFGIVSLVIFSVFRSAVRSQEIGDRETEMIERARFVFDTFERDMANVFFRDETSYNVFVARMIEEMEMDRLRAEADNNWEAFYQKWGDPNEEDDDENKPTVGNPYEKGRLIDLQMLGKDSNSLDNLTFAVSDPLEIGKPYRAWGLSRVEYSVEKGWLIRKSETVETETRNVLGESLGKSTVPQVTRLAENVAEFDLQYSFWYDNTWYEVEDWDSTSRQIRNGRYMIGKYDNEFLATNAEGQANWRDSTRPNQTVDPNGNPNVLQPGDEGWNEYLNDLDSEPLDRLPAYVRMKLVLTDPENTARRQTFRRVFRILAAEETYTPTELLNEEGIEAERGLRDNTYDVVYPGAIENR